jgi:hypothetical protein
MLHLGGLPTRGQVSEAKPSLPPTGRNIMSDNEVLPSGKIPHELLHKLLKMLPTSGVLIAPSIGVDACAVELAGPLVSVKADPITMAKEQSGFVCLRKKIVTSQGSTS